MSIRQHTNCTSPPARLRAASNHLSRQSPKVAQPESLAGGRAKPRKPLKEKERRHRHDPGDMIPTANGPGRVASHLELPTPSHFSPLASKTISFETVVITC